MARYMVAIEVQTTLVSGNVTNNIHTLIKDMEVLTEASLALVENEQERYFKSELPRITVLTIDGIRVKVLAATKMD